MNELINVTFLPKGVKRWCLCDLNHQPLVRQTSVFFRAGNLEVLRGR